MSSIPYAPVTVLDTSSSIGAADATIIGVDFRYAGEANYSMNFIGTLIAADTVTLQVSPDWKHDAPSNAGAMWASVETFTSTSFNGSLNGPWAAIRFIKSGTQAAKVVGLVAGKQRNKLDAQG
jgi:hypothetical protein